MTDDTRIQSRVAALPLVALAVLLCGLSPACSSTAGSASDAARDTLLDGAPRGTPFACGDGALTCATGETQCREIGGQRLPDGGQLPTRYECGSFNPPCVAQDCSCFVPFGGGYYCFACEQLPSGAVILHCGPV